MKRNNRLAKLDFQVSAIEAAIARESQSKRKFEYNERLRKYKEEREMLVNNNE